MLLSQQDRQDSDLGEQNPVALSLRNADFTSFKTRVIPIEKLGSLRRRDIFNFDTASLYCYL